MLRIHQPLMGLAVAVLLGLGTSAAVADEYQSVQALGQQGKIAQALARADRYIAANPTDPQMLFIKANLLVADGRSSEAEQLLLQMTRDTPELPEPWNNLAVLRAAQGKLDEALEALQTALRLNPEYVTALENLGDVNVRIAARAYTRAKRLDAKNQTLSPKLQALRQVLAVMESSPPHNP